MRNDRIIIQKIINYIEDIEKYIENIDAKDFFDDKKQLQLVPLPFFK